MVVKLQIPENAQILVTKGQKVAFHEPFYSISSEEDTTISFTKQLGVKPQDIFKYSKVVVGDKLEEGSLLGERKKVIGMKRITADLAGVVKSIDHLSGEMVLTVASAKTVSVQTFFSGEIVDISSEGTSVSVEIGKADEIAATGPQDLGGALNYISDRDFFTCSEEDVSNRIILLDTVQSHIETKIEALGGQGIIYVEGTPTQSLPAVQMKNAKDFEKLKDEKEKSVLFSHLENKLYIYL